MHIAHTVSFRSGIVRSLGPPSDRPLNAFTRGHASFSE